MFPHRGRYRHNAASETGELLLNVWKHRWHQSARKYGHTLEGQWETDESYTCCIMDILITGICGFVGSTLPAR
jgi:hypothetical protein